MPFTQNVLLKLVGTLKGGNLVNRTAVQWSIVGGLSIVWSALLFDPVVAFVPCIITFYCFLLILAISAVEWRSRGWISGLLFATLAATMPVWVITLFWLYRMI